MQKKCDVLAVVITWIDQQLHGDGEMADGWDGYLHLVMKEYASAYEPPSDLWAEIKAKVQREVALNQVQSFVP